MKPLFVSLFVSFLFFVSYVQPLKRQKKHVNKNIYFDMCMVWQYINYCIGEDESGYWRYNGFNFYVYNKRHKKRETFTKNIYEDVVISPIAFANDSLILGQFKALTKFVEFRENIRRRQTGSAFRKRQSVRFDRPNVSLADLFEGEVCQTEIDGVSGRLEITADILDTSLDLSLIRTIEPTPVYQEEYTYYKTYYQLANYPSVRYYVKINNGYTDSQYIKLRKRIKDTDSRYLESWELPDSVKGPSLTPSLLKKGKKHF